MKLGGNTDDLVEKARLRCERAHAGQTRDDGSPYAEHPAAVVAILREQNVTDPSVLAAAWLHDVLEDTEVTADELEKEFGPEVVSLVQELTNKGAPNRTFDEKHRSLAEEAKRMSPAAKQVKLADRLHNLQQMSCWQEQRCARYARATINLLEALKPWPLPKLAERINTLVESYLAISKTKT